MSTKPNAPHTARRAGAWGAVWLAASAALTVGSAQAQSASSTLSSYRIGYGAGLSGLESPVNLSLVSAGSQFTISDGVNTAGSVGSVFSASTSNTPASSSQTPSSQTSGGAGQSYSGVGQLAASYARAPAAVMDVSNLNVASPRQPATAPAAQTNTPVLPASATTGAPTDGIAPNETVLNGKVNLDGGQ